MSKIFLCHASEDKAVAERIQLALVNAGHEVFYDELSLPPAADFHARIELGIQECALFVFLISPSSIAEGKFTLTELKFARARWPSPVGRVLAVNLQRLPANQVPAYLAAATMLEVAGNPASEVRAAAENMLRAGGKRLRRFGLGAGIAVVAAVGAIVAWRLLHPEPPAMPRMGQLQHGWNYAHNDLAADKWLTAVSADACADMCYMRDDCKAMTYVVSNKSCWLKYAVPSPTRDADMVSSAKQLPR